MAKSSFIKKQMEQALPNAGKFGLNTAGALASAAALSHGKVLPGKKKWLTTGMAAAALINCLVNPEQYSRAFVDGAGAIASVHALAAWSKKPAMFGVNPAAVDLKEVTEVKDGKTVVTYVQVDKNGTPVSGTSSGTGAAFDWKALAEEAAATPAADVAGIDEDDDIAGPEYDTAEMVDELFG